MLRKNFQWLSPALWIFILIVLTFNLQWLIPIFHFFAPQANTTIYPRSDMFSLLVQHILLVTVASFIAIFIGLIVGIITTRPKWQDFLPLAIRVSSVGQTFPPIVVLALAVPLFGFGNIPTALALIIYSVLPIFANTIAGIQSVDPAVLDAAKGMGMTERQILFQVELPLAKEIILAGIRSSVTITIATAAMGSTVGSNTLGDPIIAGLINYNIAFIVQGSLLIGLLAISVDSIFEYFSKQ
ncbi:UNVERIFIED_CONTAM: hypothetical protein GTU68_052137 [Idotea baltica]|nr:hypothetical protein [Idotea baltica]